MAHDIVSSLNKAIRDGWPAAEQDYVEKQHNALHQALDLKHFFQFKHISNASKPLTIHLSKCTENSQRASKERKIIL